MSRIADICYLTAAIGTSLYFAHVLKDVKPTNVRTTDQNVYYTTHNPRIAAVAKGFIKESNR